MCWPAYAALFSSVGLSFLLTEAYLLPLTALFMAIAVASLGFRALTRRGYGPLALGLAATAAVMTGKYVLNQEVITYGGVVLLVAASVWNGWPRR